MASKRAERARVCGSKHRYETLEPAIAAASALNRKRRGAGAVRMGAYRCRFCRQFHIGHLNRAARRSMTARQANRAAAKALAS